MGQDVGCMPIYVVKLNCEAHSYLSQLLKIGKYCYAVT